MKIPYFLEREKRGLEKDIAKETSEILISAYQVELDKVQSVIDQLEMLDKIKCLVLTDDALALTKIKEILINDKK